MLFVGSARTSHLTILSLPFAIIGIDTSLLFSVFESGQNIINPPSTELTLTIESKESALLLL